MALAPVCFEETTVVLSALEAELAAHNHLLASPVSLHQKLLQFAEEVLLKDARSHGYNGDAASLPTPPSWPAFAERWLKRTTHFLFCCEYEETDCEHRGTHLDGHRTCFNAGFEYESDDENDYSDDEEGVSDDETYGSMGDRVLPAESEMVMDRWCA